MNKHMNDNLKYAVLATDIALFTYRDGELLVRLAKVDRPHIKEKRALPGGLILPDETALESAKGILKNKGCIDPNKVHFEQLYTFSEIDRDPRGRVVSVAYSGYVSWEDLSPSEQSSTLDSWWSTIKQATGLGYDHDDMLLFALSRLRARIGYTTLISKLLPKEFTLTELETAYENLLGYDIDKRNFRKKITKLRLLQKLDRTKVTGAHRPAILYRFKKDGIQEIEMI